MEKMLALVTRIIISIAFNTNSCISFCNFFGKLSKKFKTKNLLNVCIIGYFLIALFALQLDKTWEFWFLSICVAMFQGAIQAFSRSYFAKIIPKEKSSEYFGFFDIFGKGASFMGTILMGITTQLSDNSRKGVAFLSLMFVFGFIVFQKAVKMQNEKDSLKLRN